MAEEAKKIHLKNVRLSFPSIFNRAVHKSKDGTKEGKFEATFLFPKSDKKMHKMLSDAIEDAIAQSKLKIPAENRCLKDGDGYEYDGYEGHWAFKASSNKRPTVIDRDRSVLVEEDDRPYAGCYVNAIVDLWVQNNEFGKRVNANLYGIQFVKDGEAFGSGPVDVTDEFDDLDEDDDL